MPCGTFTSARRYDGKRPKPLRSREHILGFPILCGRDKLRVDLANELVDLMYDLCLLCWKTSTSFYIENPRSSLLWAMPRMKLLASLPGVQKKSFDYCQFGAPWKKPTTVLFVGNTFFKQNESVCAVREMKYVPSLVLLASLYRATLEIARKSYHFVHLLLNPILQHFVPNGHS